MHPYSFPIPKLTAALIVGILASEFVVPNINVMCLILGFIFLLSLIFHYKKSIYNGLIVSCLLLLLFVVLGAFGAQLHHPKTHKNHYSYFLKKDNTDTLVLCITEEMNPTAYNNRYKAKVLQINQQKSKGIILVQTPKDTAIAAYKTDDLLYIKTKIQAINSPQNPHVFSYKKYLERKGIYHLITIDSQGGSLTKKGRKSIKGMASMARNFLDNKIDKLTLNSTAQAFLKAFYLGKRSEIPEDIKVNYKNSGVLHILALSGLHVGILLKILELLLFPISRTRNGKKLRSVMIIIILWAFAFITGLSPSIVRSVTMFSCFALASGLNRQRNSINTLSISAFVMLIIHPNYVFDVGFQFSYGAVLGILVIKPILDHFWRAKHFLIKPIITLLNVSIAAQIGILPLSLYYFHQFPCLFFLANLLIIPTLTLCLWLGFFMIIFEGLKINDWLVYVFEHLIQLMNSCTKFVADLEFFLFKNITFDLYMLMLLYLIILVFFSYITKKTFKNLLVLGSAILLLQLYVLFTFKFDTKQKFIIFQKTKHSVLGFKNGTNFEIHSTKKNNIQSSFTTDYATAKGVEKISNSSLKRFYFISDKKLLVVDSLGYFDFKAVKFNWILLRNSPKIHLEKLIETLQPELIIADGSNYRSFVKRWIKTCVNKGIKLHYTFEDGAFIYDLNHGAKEGLNDL